MCYVIKMLYNLVSVTFKMFVFVSIFLNYCINTCKSYNRGGQPKAHVPKVTRLSNFDVTQKIKILNNYDIHKMLLVKSSKKQIMNILKIIIFLYKIDYVTIFILLFTTFGHVKNCQTLDCKYLALDLKKFCHPCHLTIFRIFFYTPIFSVSKN